ncbi:MAG TPA: DUF5916 domain-containing protein [Holophagaceae bacterium]|nr:DUF5916 domain-containing protein [Holophagaceae bacterium]HJW32243.1 DUF5916 domain-containing protein [Holophagaceae bacterium]
MRLLLPFLSTFAVAAQPTPSGLRAVRVGQPPVIDGRLEEAVWQTAPAAGGFQQMYPAYGQPSQFRTEVRVLYDDRYLYVGARMWQIPGAHKTSLQLYRRDRQTYGTDLFGVYIDPLRDGRTAYGFILNAAGVQRDELKVNDVDSDDSWDAVWESATTQDADGWTAEFKIPLDILRLQKGGGPQTWGIQFFRQDALAAREVSFWTVPPREQRAFVSVFPPLTGIEGVEPRPRREFLPYLSASRKFETANGRKPETAQFGDDRGTTLKAGLDGRVSLTPHSQVDFTLHPDFGQVEVDSAVLNLSTVETFLPEKRPFFLEGSEIFNIDSGGRLFFYSRRIGKGLATPDLAPGEILVDRPLAANIAGALKYSAKYATGTQVGLLAGGLEVEKARILDGSGQPRDQEVSPFTAFGVLRTTQALDSAGSYVGAFASSLRQASADGALATVGALDALLRSADRRSSLSIVGAGSQTGAREGDRHDGAYGRLEWVHRFNGSGLELDLAAVNAGRRFDLNDLGYLARSDEKALALGISRQWDGQWGIFRNPELAFSGREAQDQAGRTIQQNWGLRGRTDFVNSWTMWFGANLQGAYLDDQEVRVVDSKTGAVVPIFLGPDKKYLSRPGGSDWFISADTDSSKPYYARVEVGRNHPRDGHPGHHLQLVQIMRPRHDVEVELEVSTRHQGGELAWLEEQGGTPILGQRRLTLAEATLRVGWTFTPHAGIQLYSQWLGYSYAFRDLRSWVDADTLQPGATSAQPVASDRLWNLNAIGRWEFHPGSTAYLVYTHGTDTTALVNPRGTFAPGRDLRLLNHLPSDDVVQVKVSWLFR